MERWARPEARAISSDEEDDHHRQLLSASIFASLDLDIQPAPAPSHAAAHGGVGLGPSSSDAKTHTPDPTADSLSSLHGLRLAAPPGLTPAIPCTDKASADPSVYHQLALTQTLLAQAQAQNGKLAAALKEQRARGREQHEQIKLLSRLNRDFRKEITTLQAQVWSQMSSTLKVTPPPNPGQQRMVAQAPPQQQQRQKHAAAAAAAAAQQQQQQQHVAFFLAEALPAAAYR